jgi:hypothetical protein
LLAVSSPLVKGGRGAAEEVVAVISRERPAEPGELCTCGRQTVTVFLSGECRPVGWCGISDGGRWSDSCPFCGGPTHDGERCEAYTLRPGRPG